MTLLPPLLLAQNFGPLLGRTVSAETKPGLVRHLSFVNHLTFSLMLLAIWGTMWDHIRSTG